MVNESDIKLYTVRSGRMLVAVNEFRAVSKEEAKTLFQQFLAEGRLAEYELNMGITVDEVV